MKMMVKYQPFDENVHWMVIQDIQQQLSISIWDPNYLGISLLFHPLPLDSEML